MSHLSKYECTCGSLATGGACGVHFQFYESANKVQASEIEQLRAQLNEAYRDFKTLNEAHTTLHERTWKAEDRLAIATEVLKSVSAELSGHRDKPHADNCWGCALQDIYLQPALARIKELSPSIDDPKSVLPDTTPAMREGLYLQVVRDWKGHWMLKEPGYMERAHGIDANMLHDLARRLMQAEKGNSQ